MKKKGFGLAAIMLVALGFGQALLAPPAHAEILCPNGKPPKDSSKGYEGCQGTVSETTKGTGNASNLGNTGFFSNKDMMNTLNTVLNVVVGLVGFVSIAVIIVGGITFATSQGDTARTTKAKNMILFGIVGLIVALLAFAIVNFVLTNVFTNSSGESGGNTPI